MKTAEPRLTPVSRTSPLTWAMMTLLVFAACALACGLPMPDLGPSPTELLPGVAPQTPGPKPLVCQSLSLERQSGSPLDQVGFSWQGSKASSFAVIVRHETGDYLTTAQRVEGSEDWRLSVPFHPELFEGGQVGLEVVLIEETEDDARQVSCGVYPFEVEGIKRAPGTMAKIIERSEQLLSLRAQSLGFDLETLRAADLSQLPTMLYGPAYAAYALNDPNNSRSLAAIIEGSNPELEELHQEVERAEAILAHAGYVEDLEYRLGAQGRFNESLRDSPLKFKELSLLSATPNGASGCGLDKIKIVDIKNGDELSHWMVKAQELEKASDREFNKDLNLILAFVGLIPHPVLQLASAIGQLALCIDKYLNQMYANQLPRELFSGRVVIPATLEEGRDEGGVWSNYTVMARGKSWDLNGLVLDSLLAIFPVADGFVGLKAGLGLIQKSGKTLKEILRNSEFIQEITKGYAKTYLLNNLSALFQALDNFEKKHRLCAVPAQKWGPFEVSGNVTREFEGVIESSDIRYKHPFKITAAGEGRVVLRASPGLYPPATNEKKSEAIGIVNVLPVEVKVSPGSALLPRQGLVLTAQVERTDDLAVSWEIAHPKDVTGLSLEPMAEDEYGRGRVKLLVEPTAVVDRVVVRATSLSRQGIRWMPDAPARSGVGVYLNRVGVLVSPSVTCIKPSESVQLKATVMGHEDQRVRWSADGGHVDESGRFSASKVGFYKVTATSAADAGASDRATVEVKTDCACKWSALISGPGAVAWGDSAGVQMVYAQGQLDVLLTDAKGNTVNLKALNGVYGSRDELDANVSWGQLGTYNAHAIFKATQSGDTLVDALTTLESGPKTMTITRWDGNYIEGFYSGSVSVFGTALLPPSQQLSAAVQVQFTGYVQDASNILNLVTSQVCP